MQNTMVGGGIKWVGIPAGGKMKNEDLVGKNCIEEVETRPKILNRIFFIQMSSCGLKLLCSANE